MINVMNYIISSTLLIETRTCWGIAKNPYVRVSGASGGAFTATLMMYGADTRKVVEVLLQSAARV